MTTDGKAPSANPWTGFQGHERVVVSEDQSTGLRAVVAVHSTALGPALGGTRFLSYQHTSDPGAAAYADALRLSQAMSLKNALAGLPHGGGKGVILASSPQPTEALLEAYGRAVAVLQGQYVTAGDVGVSVADLDVIARTCPWTTGRSPDKGGLGDTGILTAIGVWQGMRGCAEFTWGSPELTGRRIGILGVGKVGGRLAERCVQDGAEVIVADVNAAAIDRLRDALPEVTVVPSPQALLEAELDICSLNATGGMLTAEVASQLRAAVICGAANNQLAEPEVAQLLAERGVLYAPDFMVNCGGVIQAAAEYAKTDFASAEQQARRVFETTLTVLERASRAGATPSAAAQAEAEDRIDTARRAGG